MPVPAFEDGDEVCFFARVKTNHELKLSAMPAVVCYRILQDSEFRIGLKFMPARSMFQESSASRQAGAIELFLSNTLGYAKPEVSNNNPQIKVPST